MDIILALTTGILFSGALVGAAMLGACAGVAGSCWWLWRRYGKKPPPDR
ncbi:hypothetical protein RXV95_12560 [Novosphingobium sp. ZN18A2]